MKRKRRRRWLVNNLLQKKGHKLLATKSRLFSAVLALAHSHPGQGNVPTFYTYEEGLSHLTAEGQATLQRLEGMLAQSVTQQFHMAGVRTDEPQAEFEGL